MIRNIMQSISLFFAKYKEQYRQNLTLALPIVLTHVGQILTQVADNLMVGNYGGENPEPLAAVSFGGSVFSILFLASIGVAFGLTPLVGELYVQGKHRRAASLLQNGMTFYILIGLVVSAVQYASTPLLYMMGQPVEVVDMAIPYYRMMMLSMPFIMMFFSFKQFLEGTGNTKAELMVTIVSNISNILFNWIFIYGNMGMPEMGVEGAGLGTLLARVIAAVLMACYFIWHRRYRAYFKFFAFSNYSRKTVARLLHMGLPISAQMFLESSAFIGTSIMMGWFGKTAMSANQIVGTLSNSAFMIVVSIGAATTIITSHCYGQRDIGRLTLAMKASYHIVLAWNALAAVVFIGLCRFIPTLFTANAEVVDIAATLCIFTAFFQLSDGLQNISVGILRGLQDVKVIMPIAVIAYWLLNLPVGYVLAFVLDMGPAGLYCGFIIGLSVAGVLLMLRIHRRIKQLKHGDAM